MYDVLHSFLKLLLHRYQTTKMTPNIATFGLGIFKKGQTFTSNVSHGLTAWLLIVIAKFSGVFFKDEPS